MLNILYILVEGAIPVLPFIALICPLKGLPRRSFWLALALQVGLMILWALLGGTVIARLWWRLSGGCAAHGGGFEGACGYAGFATQVMAGYATAVVMTSICGILLRYAIKKY